MPSTKVAPGQPCPRLLEADTEPLASMEVENTVSPDMSASLLTIVHNANGTVTITWPNDGWTLQEANDVTGSRTNSPTQTSPVNLAPGAAKKFYRLFPP